jgi:GTPase SAR1 family protein
MKTYKIITLGASGAGKTVFLSSMFRALSIQGDYTFFLEIEDRTKEKILNAIYTNVITGDSWPEGTRYSEVSEWTFTCRVQTPTLESYTACQFTYFDYAGGRLTDSSEEDPEFDSIVEQATSVLGLLDGSKIYELMKESKNLLVDTFLNKDLPNIIKHMRKSTVPIHFVISKWDLIEDEFSLKQVRERLLKIPDFQELIRMRNFANSPVRLIPVSSIGSGFAIPQLNGGMKKILGAVPHPFQLEAPLACVLPDGLQARISALHKKQEEIESMQIETKNMISEFISVFGKTGKTILDIFGGLAFLLPDEYQFARPIVAILSQGINYGVGKHEKSLIERSEKLKKEREVSMKLVKDEESSLQHAVYNFALIENKLMRNFPESELILT